MKTNQQILEQIFGWPEGSLTGTDDFSLDVKLSRVYAAMDAVRKEIRQKIQSDIEAYGETIDPENADKIVALEDLLEDMK